MSFRRRVCSESMLVPNEWHCQIMTIANATVVAKTCLRPNSHGHKFLASAMARNIVVIASRFNECCCNCRQIAKATVVVNLIRKGCHGKSFPFRRALDWTKWIAEDVTQDRTLGDFFSISRTLPSMFPNGGDRPSCRIVRRNQEGRSIRSKAKSMPSPDCNKLGSRVTAHNSPVAYIVSDMPFQPSLLTALKSFKSARHRQIVQQPILS